MSDVQKFWVSFVMICVASMCLHMVVFSKRQAQFQHHPPVYPDTAATPGSRDAFRPQGQPVQGKVTALGVDRFYLEVDGHQEMFLYGQLDQRPEINQPYRVEYYQGAPPTALKVEKL